MSTNYYVIRKQDNDKINAIYDDYKCIDDYNLNDKIKTLILDCLKDKIKTISSYNDLKSRLDDFNNDLDDAVTKFISNLKYNVLDNFDLDDEYMIHIGKSSLGWLFCFQSQDRWLEDIHIKWNSYNDLKKWLIEYVDNKRQFIIVSENDEVLTTKQLLELIDNKQKDPRNINNPDNFTYCSNIDGYRFTDGDFS